MFIDVIVIVGVHVEVKECLMFIGNVALHAQVLLEFIIVYGVVLFK